MRVGLLWLIALFPVTEGIKGFLQKNHDNQTKGDVGVVEKRDPAQEYEILLQMTYRNPGEKRELKRFLKHLKSPSPSQCLHGPSKIVGVKATTYCRNLKGFPECACEDSYMWFPPSCLDPQNCYLHTTGPLPSCNCPLKDLSRSVNFCERAKVWGTFKINGAFIKDLWNSSSAVYANYRTEIEKQLEEAYRGIHGFESVQVTQFREGSIVVGYEVTGSSSTAELLSALEKVAEEALVTLKRQFSVEDGSFRVFGKAPCNSVSFGFGSEDDEYTLPCSSGFLGNITVRCQHSGWQVTKEYCVLSQLAELKKNFSMLSSNVTEADVSSLVQNLSAIVQQSPSTTAGTLASVVSLLRGVSSLSLKNSLTVSNLTLQNVINIANHILDSASIANWTILSQEDRSTSSQLLEALEITSILVPSSNLPLHFSQTFIDWKGIPVTQIQSTQGYNYQIEMRQQNASQPIQGHVLIKPDQFQKPHPKTIISMTSLTFGSILPTTHGGSAQINGPVISTLIQNYSINEIFLNLSKIKGNLSQPHCVFWDFSHLQWSDAGCQLVNETADTVLCRCTHLTAFSMLMSPLVPSSVVPVVKWITYIGLGISIASLILCLIIEFLFWKQTKKSQTSYTRHVCLVNTALSLLIADVWFIVAAIVDPTASGSGVCVAAVFFTHFFYLALFFWMLALGILLAYRIVFVFHHMALPTMMAIGFCLGYGCPLLISIITIAVTQPSNSYRRNNVCWLNWSDESKPLLAFVVPALTIVAVNLAVVLLVLRKLWRPAVGDRLSQDDKVIAIRMGKSLLVLTPLLGLTWGFGIGTMVDSQNLAWHVLFALLNAFQGFFIFCFGILLDNKLRQLLSDKLTPLSSWKQTSKQNSSDIVTKSKCLKPFSILQHKGMYALSHTGDSSNEITLTQFLSME